MNRLNAGAGLVQYIRTMDKGVEQKGGKLLDDAVEYSCLKCTFDLYHRKADIRMRTCDKLEMEKLYGEEY